MPESQAKRAAGVAGFAGPGGHDMTPLARPRRLSRGTVGIIAPASPFPEDRFERGLTVLRSMDLQPVIDPRIRERSGYLAGDDPTRLAVLAEQLADPAIEAIWAARGGYGLHRLLGRIDPALLRRAEKPIIGFSDVAALHAVANQAGLITFHGPVVTQLGELGPDSDEAKLLCKLLFEAPGPLRYSASGPAIHGGRARGRLFGGCLSVLSPMIGTPYLPSLEGAILLLEDVGEATYRIDRLLTHLLNAGILQRVAGIALGDFIGCRPRQPDEPSVEQVLSERLGGLSVPVLSGLPFGHGQRNLPVPLGAIAVLDAERGELEIEA